jgi:SMI1/KNR4 family protein SUKH-1
VTGFDYAGWAVRAREFVAALVRSEHARVQSVSADPPVSMVEIVDIERALGSRLPDPLRGFFILGSGGLDCRYVFEPDGRALDELRDLLPLQITLFGGACIGPALELPGLASDVRDWANETWVADDPNQKRIWASALPFAKLDNGDYLALDRRDGAQDPPVVYLDHEDESRVIAPSFVAFLNAWEQLCYLGPEHWLLLEFTDDDGLLDPDTPRAARLRALISPPDTE